MKGRGSIFAKNAKTGVSASFFFFFSSFILCTARISWLIPLCENVANISRTSNINSCMDVVRFLLLHYLLNYTHIPNSNLLCFTKPWFSFIVLFQPFLQLAGSVLVKFPKDIIRSIVTYGFPCASEPQIPISLLLISLSLLSNS